MTSIDVRRRVPRSSAVCVLLVAIAAMILQREATAAIVPGEPLKDALSQLSDEYDPASFFYTSCIDADFDKTEKYDTYLLLMRGTRDRAEQDAVIFSIARDDERALVDIAYFSISHYIAEKFLAIQGGLGVDEHMRQIAQPLLARPMNLGFSVENMFAERPQQACQLAPSGYWDTERVHYSPENVTLRGRVILNVAADPEVSADVKGLPVLELEPVVGLDGDKDPASPNHDDLQFLNDAYIASSDPAAARILALAARSGRPVTISGRLREVAGSGNRFVVVIDATSVTATQ